MFPLLLMLGTIIQNPLVIDINFSKSSHKWVVGVAWTGLNCKQHFVYLELMQVTTGLYTYYF